MGAITPTPAPGSFLEHQSVSFAFSPDVTGVAFTLNGPTPSVSKYICYDDLTPRNPFIAVTEDGKGRVVYDGGFPKIYNGSAPAVGSGFAQFNGSFKYVYNVLKWIANQDKITAGNNKVLVLGDSTVTESYSIKSTISNSFFTSLTRIFDAVGYVPTYKDRSDYGAGLELDPTLAELEQYCCVFMISSKFDNHYISDRSVSDLVTYRENGNGIFILTDHGPIHNSIESAIAGTTGFFATANRLAVKFGAYFSGDYARTPVNCGWIRANYGDHPLYNGILDSENIVAGASESRVVVPQLVLSNPIGFPPVVTNKNGLNTIQVLVTKQDGSVETARFVFNIQGTEFVFAKVTNPTTGLEETNGGKLYADNGGKASATLWLDGTTLGTVWGELLLDGVRVGEISYDSTGGSKTHWYAGSLENMPVKKGAVLKQLVKVPFTYEKTLVVNRKQPVVDAISIANVVKSVRTEFGWAGVSDASVDLWSSIYQVLPAGMTARPIALENLCKRVRDVFNDRLQRTPTLTAKIYPTTALTTAAIAAVQAAPGLCFIDAQTNTVYGYLNGMIRAIAGLKAQNFFGAPRDVTNPTTGKTFRLELDGSITALN